MHGDVALGEQCVDHEAVPGPDLVVPQVKDDQVFMQCRTQSVSARAPP
jgi:hypothetical protein